MSLVYYVTCNIEKDKNAIAKLISKGTKTIKLSNTPEQVKFLGVMLLSYCFESLKKEFPNFIEMTVLEVGDNFAALWSAKKLGYENSYKKIKHNFKSPTIIKILNEK